MRVLVILPAYNEEEAIGPVLARLRAELPGYDVVVIDDGSTDRTADIVRATPGVTLLRLPYNLGIGGAMQTGYKYAARHRYDVAVQCDSDGQHPIARIPELVARVARGDADLAIGSRYVADTGYRPSLTRRIGKSLLSRWIDLCIGGGITDTTSGFRAANRGVIQLFARTYPEDYPEPEALVILHRHGLRAAEVPVVMQARQGGRSSIRVLHAGYYMVKVGLAVFIDLFRSYQPLEANERKETTP